MEKLIRDAILKHLNDNCLLSPQQHGFVYGRSCTTQLLKVMDKWTEILDKGAAIDAVSWTWLKRSTVRHQRLILKLKSYGFTGRLLN